MTGEDASDELNLNFPNDFPEDLKEKIDKFLASEDAKALGINSFDEFMAWQIKRLAYHFDEIVEKWIKEKELIQKTLPERVPVTNVCGCQDVKPDDCYADNKMYVTALPKEMPPLGASTCVVHMKCKKPIRSGLMKEWVEKKLPPPPMWYQVLDK